MIWINFEVRWNASYIEYGIDLVNLMTKLRINAKPKLKLYPVKNQVVEIFEKKSNHCLKTILSFC